MSVGILTGLLAAILQSLAYLATRHYVQRRPAGASRELLVLAHVWMGAFSLIVLPFVAPEHAADALRHVLAPLVLACLFYLLGQLCLMTALKHAEPSRVSPLLGFKIVVLAVMASFIVQPHAPGTAAGPVGLTWLQWLAVVLCVIAAIALNFSGAQLRRRALLAIALACVWYSISDWNIACLVTGAKLFVAGPAAPFFAGGLSYLLSGIVAVGFLPRLGTRDPKAWRDALPFAALWFTAVLFLYTCFGIEGPVLGNILQSTRGLFSILLGSLIVAWGHFHIEPFSAKAVFLRRLAAGVLMFLAVSLYVIRDPAKLMMTQPQTRNEAAPQGTPHGSEPRVPFPAHPSTTPER